MLWNTLPVFLIPPVFIVGPIVDILIFPIWIQTAWIELTWNIFFISNILVEFLLTPYYIGEFWNTLFTAMD